MLETIFNWTTTAIGGACEWIVNLALAYLGFDLQLYENVFPLLGQAYEIFRAVGIGLAILFAAVGLAKYQFGELEEQTETPWQILIRTFIAIGLIYVGGHVLVWVINIAKTPYDAMLQLNSTTTFGLPRFTSDSLL